MQNEVNVEDQLFIGQRWELPVERYSPEDTAQYVPRTVSEEGEELPMHCPTTQLSLPLEGEVQCHLAIFLRNSKICTVSSS